MRPKLALLFRTPRQARGTEFDTRPHRARETHTRNLIFTTCVLDTFEESRKPPRINSDYFQFSAGRDSANGRIILNPAPPSGELS